MRLLRPPRNLSRLVPLILLFSPAACTKCVASIVEPKYFRLGSCKISTNSAWYPDGVTEIDSWGFQITVGNPPQPLCVEPSIVVNNLILMTSNVCISDPRNDTIAQCVSRRGGLLNPKSALATPGQNDSSLDILASDPGWEQFNPPISKAANVTVELPSDLSLESFPIGLPENATNSSVGQLGLNSNSTFLRRLLEKGVSTANAFSFSAGSQSPTKPRDGHLIIGGFDEGSLTGPFTIFPMNGTVTAGKRSCALHVVVDGLILSRPGEDDFTIISAGSTMPSCIEPLDNLFRFPEDKLKEFRDLTGWNENTKLSEDMIVVEPGLYYNSLFNGSLKFSLEGGLSVEIPAEELSWRARGIDTKGARVLDQNTTVVNIFNQTAPESTAILGKAFLSQLSLIVDYDRQEFKLAPVDTGSSNVLNIVPFSNSSSFDCPSASKGNHWPIGVIVLAVVLGLLILLILLYIYRERVLTKKQKKVDDSLIERRKDSEFPEVVQDPSPTRRMNRLDSNSSGIPPSIVAQTSISPPDLHRRTSDFNYFPNMEPLTELGPTDFRSRST